MRERDAQEAQEAAEAEEMRREQEEECLQDYDSLKGNEIISEHSTEEQHT